MYYIYDIFEFCTHVVHSILIHIRINVQGVKRPYVSMQVCEVRIFEHVYVLNDEGPLCYEQRLDNDVKIKEMTFEMHMGKLNIGEITVLHMYIYYMYNTYVWVKKF